MKVGFVSLGCPKNLVDGEVMLGLVREAGHDITPHAEQADVVVVNTCAFIDRAKEESIDAILEMARLKRDGSCRSLVVTGCLAERYRDELRREIPEIDVCLGTGEVPTILGALQPAAHPVALFRSRQEALDGAPGAQAARPRPTYLYDASTPRLLTTPGHYAYIKIAEGCDYTCAFCIIPTLRGAYRSRTSTSVLDEARQLVGKGVRELLLVSQDSTFFGIDRGERGALARLLRGLDAVPGLERIRLLYLYPTTITDDVLDAMAECAKVCKYVDLPLQHAAAPVLKRMGRPGNRGSYERLLSRIRSRIPDVTLRTTLIVGFPGETSEHFDELCDFARTIEFDHVGVFTYSHEEGTRAHGFEDDVLPRTKEARRRELMRLQKRIVERRQRSRIGQLARVMIDGPSPDSPLVWQGRLDGQAPDIDPVVYLDGCDPGQLRPGQMIEGRVTGARGYDLIVAVASPERRFAPAVDGPV
jgi:ribosomal protein S12 methylthiotransferase